MAERFPPAFLEELRARLPVSTVVSKRVKLTKSGHEWKGLSPFNKEKTPSFCVNDEKQFFFDHSSGRHGTIFDFVMLTTGCSFVQAVEELARDAGMPLPGKQQYKPNGNGAAHYDDSPPLSSYANGNGHEHAAPQSSSGRREIVATYDYVDADGVLIYQVCRQEWIEGGSRRKSFVQRRPGPGGAWAWGLSSGTYLRSRTNGEWYQATKERLAKWRDAEQCDLGEVAHGLYRFDELRELLIPDPEDPTFKPLVFVAEGEKDCETLRAWGLFGTTNSGGAKNWRDYHAEYLRDADVVVLTDNDTAGKQRAHAVAISLRPIAKRVRVLYWAEHWPGAPDGADVTDWRDQAKGTADDLCRIIDRLKPWTPQIPDSQLGALRFLDLGKPRRHLEWLVKGVLQRGEMSIWYGDFSTGKSFILSDVAYSIARNGLTWMGMRTTPGLVLYQIGEGAIGFGNRMEAYRLHHQIPADEDIPFIALRSRVNLHNNDDDAKKLIEEAKAWNAYYDLPLRLIVIDTFSAATSGADENAGRDVGPVLERGRRICTETGVHVAIVHHVPKGGGSPRGWSGFLGNVDSAVMVDTLDQHHEYTYPDGRVRRLAIHQFKLTKQKDGELGLARQFILPQVKLGIDGDGDPITSCVVVEVGDRVEKIKSGGPKVCPSGYYEIKETNNEQIFRCLVSALRKHGVDRQIPAGNRAPRGSLVCTIGEWQKELIELSVGHEEITITLRERLKKRIQRAQAAWLAGALGKGANLIDKDGEFVWRTTRKVWPIDPAPPRINNPEPTAELEQQQGMILAPGERPEDIGNF